MGGLGGKEEGEENSRAAVGFEAGGVLLPESGWMSGPNTQPDQEPLGWQPCARAQSLSRVQLFVTHGLAPARLLCPWSFPGKNTGVGCHFLSQHGGSVFSSNLVPTVCKAPCDGICMSPTSGSHTMLVQCCFCLNSRVLP